MGALSFLWWVMCIYRDRNLWKAIEPADTLYDWFHKAKSKFQRFWLSDCFCLWAYDKAQDRSLIYHPQVLTRKYKEVLLLRTTQSIWSSSVFTQLPSWFLFIFPEEHMFMANMDSCHFFKSTLLGYNFHTKCTHFKCMVQWILRNVDTNVILTTMKTQNNSINL